MTLAIISRHDPACTGCPACSELAAAILDNPTNPILSTAMGNRRLRALAEDALRAANSREAFAQPPDPYEPALARMRAVQQRGAEHEECIAADFHVSVETWRSHEPPDPYAAGLARLQKENQC